MRKRFKTFLAEQCLTRARCTSMCTRIPENNMVPTRPLAQRYIYVCILTHSLNYSELHVFGIYVVNVESILRSFG